MSKLIKAIALIVVAVAVIVFAPQIAGFLAHTFVGLAFATTAAITSTVVSIGLSLALAAAGTLFTKTPSLSSANQDRLQATVDPTAPRKIVFGLTAAGNDVRFFETYGSKQDQYCQVIALASHKVNAIKGFYVENDLTWNGTSLVAHQDGISAFRAVAEGNSINGQALGSGNYWTSTATFTGCAYVAVSYKLDSKAWPSGVPSNVRTVVEGCPVYDPRLDDINGGSGPHRIADQTTWTYRSPTTNVEIGRNPALCMLAYLIGWRINGKLSWGMGIPASRINFENFRTYANVCEEQITAADGTPVQRYTCDGAFQTSDSHESIITAIAAAMGSCKLLDVGGTYGFVGGYDDTLGPKQALNDDDIVGAPGSSTPFSWVPKGPPDQTYNIARGRFPDPNNQYQLADWGSVETDALPDGVERTLTLDLGCVSRAGACQRIAKQMIAREALTPGFFSATFGPRAFAVNVGDLVTLTVSSLGWNAKLFRVTEQHETPQLLFQMTLREESSAVYAWDKDEEKALPAAIIPTGYDPSLEFSVQGMALSSVTYEAVA